MYVTVIELKCYAEAHRYVLQVTGATGVLGSHVVSQLLEQSYTVRAAVRPGKVQRLRDIFPAAGTRLQTTEVASLTSDFATAVKDVGAVIHCASPAYFKGEGAKDILDVLILFITALEALLTSLRNLIMDVGSVSWDVEHRQYCN